MEEFETYEKPKISSLNGNPYQPAPLALAALVLPVAGLVALVLTTVVAYTQGIIIAVAAGVGVVHAVVGANVTPTAK
ncbi:MAG: hypothetical protein K2K85_02240 [Clostridia bacterium]|nr:hypothetical protein [Clostridia bacterium]